MVDAIQGASGAPKKASLNLRGLPINCVDAVTRIARELFSEKHCPESVVLGEVALLVEAVRRANTQQLSSVSLDFSPYWRVASSVADNGRLGQAFRAAHMISHREFLMTARELAFGEMPDEVREEMSRFCELMYRGHQLRFLDRHPDETPEQFLDRPRKATLNMTRRIVRLKSLLYTAPPVRDIDEAATKGAIAEAAAAMFANPLYNLALLEADRYSRLLGTVSIRPFYDPKSPGRVRLHMFMSHQLRVVLNMAKPWEPLAVIERQNPYAGSPQYVIWTARSVLTLCGDKAEGRVHSMGRIPHTFFRSEQSFSSFFVEGEGRDLAVANTTLNDKLSDLNEVIQFQGFSSAEVVNPESETPALGPRTGLIFRPKDNTVPFGINYKRPGAPLREMREDIAQDIADLLMAHGVPIEAMGGFKGRVLSGFALRQIMQPILADNKLRGMVFAPLEVDLADACIRVRAEHDTSFSAELPKDEPAVAMSVRFEDPPMAIEMTEQTQRDDLDLSYGITTPAEIIQRSDPARYPTLADAEKKWSENLAAMRAAGLHMRPIETPVTGPAEAGATLPPRTGTAPVAPPDRLDAALDHALAFPVPGDVGIGRLLNSGSRNGV